MDYSMERSSPVQKYKDLVAFAVRTFQDRLNNEYKKIRGEIQAIQAGAGEESSKQHRLAYLEHARQLVEASAKEEFTKELELAHKYLMQQQEELTESERIDNKAALIDSERMWQELKSNIG